MIYLTKIGDVLSYERSTLERVERPPNPNRRSGLDSFHRLYESEKLVVRIIPRTNQRLLLWSKAYNEPTSFLRKLWRIENVEFPEARGGGGVVTIHFVRDYEVGSKA